MDSSRPSVFVYGTLLFEEVTDALQIRSRGISGEIVPLKRFAAELKHYRRFTVKPGRRGAYPAIIPGEGTVKGMVLSELTRDSLETLDAFEGIDSGLYHREVVEVLDREHKKHKAFAYICGDAMRPHLKSDWEPEEFLKNELAWYLRHVVNAG